MYFFVFNLLINDLLFAHHLHNYIINDDLEMRNVFGMDNDKKYFFLAKVTDAINKTASQIVLLDNSTYFVIFLCTRY